MTVETFNGRRYSDWSMEQIEPSQNYSQPVGFRLTPSMELAGCFELFAEGGAAVRRNLKSAVGGNL